MRLNNHRPLKFRGCSSGRVDRMEVALVQYNNAGCRGWRHRSVNRAALVRPDAGSSPCNSLTALVGTQIPISSPRFLLSVLPRVRDDMVHTACHAIEAGVVCANGAQIYIFEMNVSRGP